MPPPKLTEDERKLRQEARNRRRREMRRHLTPERREAMIRQRQRRRSKLTIEQRLEINSKQRERRRRSKMTLEQLEQATSDPLTIEGDLEEGVVKDEMEEERSWINSSSGSDAGEGEDTEEKPVDEDWEISKITLDNLECNNKDNNTPMPSKRRLGISRDHQKPVAVVPVAPGKRNITAKMRRQRESYHRQLEKNRKSKEQQISRVNLLRRGRTHHELTNLIKSHIIQKDNRGEETTRASDIEPLLKTDEDELTLSSLCKMGRDRLLNSGSRTATSTLYGEEEQKYTGRRKRQRAIKGSIKSLKEEEEGKFMDFLLYEISVEFHDQRKRLTDEMLELEYGDKVPSLEPPPWLTEGVGSWAVNYDLAVNSNLSHGTGYVIPTEDPFAELHESNVKRNEQSSTLDPKGSANDCSSRTGGTPRKSKRKQNSLDSDGEEDSLDAVNEAFDSIQKQADKRSRNNESTDDIQDWIARAIAEEVECEQNSEVGQEATKMRLETLEKVRDIVQNSQLEDDQPVTSGSSLVFYYRQLAVRRIQNEKMQKWRELYQNAREKWIKERPEDQGLLEKLDEDRKQLKDNFQTVAREKIKKFTEFLIARRKLLSLETQEYRNCRLEKELEDSIHQVLKQLDQQDEARKEDRMESGTRKINKRREIDPATKRETCKERAKVRGKMERREYELLQLLMEAIGFTPSVCKKDEKGMKCDSYIPPPPEGKERPISIDDMENLFRIPENQSVIDFWYSYAYHGKDVEVPLYRKLLGSLLFNRRRKTQDGFDYIGATATESIEDMKTLRMFIRLHGEHILSYLSRKRWYYHNVLVNSYKRKQSTEDGKNKSNAYCRRRYHLKTKGIDVGDGYYDTKTGKIVSESRTRKPRLRPVSSTDITPTKAVSTSPKKTTLSSGTSGSGGYRRSTRARTTTYEALAPVPNEPVESEPVQTSAITAVQSNCNFQPNDSAEFCEYRSRINQPTYCGYRDFDDGWIPMGDYNYQPTLGPVLPNPNFPNAEYFSLPPSLSSVQLQTMPLPNVDNITIPSPISPISPPSPTLPDMSFEDDMHNDPDWEEEVPEMPKKRGRGRPRKFQSTTVIPSAIAWSGSVLSPSPSSQYSAVEGQQRQNLDSAELQKPSEVGEIDIERQKDHETVENVNKSEHNTGSHQLKESGATTTNEHLVNLQQRLLPYKGRDVLNLSMATFRIRIRKRFQSRYDQRILRCPFRVTPQANGDKLSNCTEKLYPRFRLMRHIREMHREHNDSWTLGVNTLKQLPGKTDFYCQQCDDRFDSYFSLREHYTQTHEKFRYCCIHCGLYLRKGDFWMDHMQLFHHEKDIINPLPCPTPMEVDVVDMFRCTECNSEFSSLSFLDEHMSQRHVLPVEGFHRSWFRCRECFKRFDSEDDRNNHLLECLSGNQTPFLCPWCKNGKLESAKALEKHIAEFHPKEPHISKEQRNQGTYIDESYKCELCPKSYISLGFVRYHMFQEHELFKYLGMLKQRGTNLETLLGRTESETLILGYKAGNKEQVQGIRREEGQQNPASSLCPVSHKDCEPQRIPSEKVHQKPAVEETVSCPICHKDGLDIHSIHNNYDRLMKTRYCVKCDRFFYFNFLAQHYESVHGIPKNEFHPLPIGHQTKPSDMIAGNSEMHSCKCSLFFTSDEIHQIHTLVQRDPGVDCKLCNMNFSTLKKRRSHRQLVHEKRKETGKEPGSERELTSEDMDKLILTTISESITCFTCRLCRKNFKTEEFLRTHIMESHKHDAFSRVFCEQCDASFCDRKGLISHVKIHHRSKPQRYICYICEKDFQNCWGTIKGHVQNVHPDSGPFAKARVKIVTMNEGSELSSKFPCNVCSMVFRKEETLKYHVATKHLSNKELVRLSFCDICGLGVYPTHLRRHISACHRVDISSWRKRDRSNTTLGLMNIFDLIQEYSEARDINPVELFRKEKRGKHGGEDEEEHDSSYSEVSDLDCDTNMDSGSSYGDEFDSDDDRVGTDEPSRNIETKKSNKPGVRTRTNNGKRKATLPVESADDDCEEGGDDYSGKSSNQHSHKINRKSKSSQKKRKPVTSESDDDDETENTSRPRRQGSDCRNKSPIISSDTSSYDNEEADGESNYIPRPTRSRSRRRNGVTKSPPETPKPTIVLTKEVIIRLKRCDDLVTKKIKPQEEGEPFTCEDDTPIKEEVINDFDF